MNKAKIIPFPGSPFPGRTKPILEIEVLQDVSRRLFEAQKIVLTLAQEDPMRHTDIAIANLIHEARRCVARNMKHYVGIPKIVKLWDDEILDWSSTTKT